MVRTKRLLAMAAVLAAVLPQVKASDLQGATVSAWQEYVAGVGARMDARLASSKPFLWADEEGDRVARLRRGEVVVAPLAGRGTLSVPNGLIHDWIGAVFMPNTTIEDLMSVVHNFDRYKEIFKPVVSDSRCLDADGSVQDFSMVWQRHVLFVNAAMRGQYHARDVAVSAHRGYSIVDSTTLQQIEDYSRSGEHLLPPDTGTGLMWRIHSLSRYEERDGGVYLEIEAVALSRDIPASLLWLVSPMVNHLSVSSMTVTLQQTRKAVEHRRLERERLLTAERKRPN